MPYSRRSTRSESPRTTWRTVGAARRGSDWWSDGGEIDLVTEMSAMTLVGAGAALFGPDSRAGAGNHAGPDQSACGVPACHGSRRSHAAPPPLPVATRVRSAKAELENVVDDHTRTLGQ